MDSFMDKLAHKLTAQEMIKANSAAEAEATERLKGEVKAYKECLDRMMSIGVTLEEEVGKVVESGLSKIDSAQVKSADLSDITDEIKSVKLLVEKLEQNMEEQKAEEAEKSVEEGKVLASEEYVHKECVKVYRNVQAVVSDINKMNEELIEDSIHGLKGKLTAVLIISILSFLASAGAIVVALLGITL